MTTKTIKVPQSLTRAATLERGEDGKPSRVSISSDIPYKRYDWWNDEEYYEVLDHGPGGLDDERLKAGLPILFNHDRDKHLARAKGYTNDGHKLTLDTGDFIWASGPFAEEKRKDIESGALPDTSVGYELVGDGICVGAKDEIPIYKFRWKLYEASAVTIPADASVGVGRQRDNKPADAPREIAIASQLQKGIDLSPEIEHTPNNQTDMIQRSRTLRLESDNGGGTGSAGSATATTPAPDISKEREAALTEYRARCKKIKAFVGSLKNDAWKRKANEVAERHMEGAADYSAFMEEVLPHFNSDVQSDADLPESGTERSGQIQVLGQRAPVPARRQTVGQQFTGAKAFKEFAAEVERSAGRRQYRSSTEDSFLMRRVNAVRAGFTSSDLSAVNLTISPEIIALGVQRLTVMDLISAGTMSTAGFVYPVENSFDPFQDAAQTVAERALKPEWEPDLTSARADAQVIAVMATVPKQFLADFSAFSSYLDSRGEYLVDIKAEQQILYGDGQGTNLAGITTRSGVQTRAYDTTNSKTSADNLFQALTDIQVNAYFEPDGYAIHPYDWEQIRLLKDANGQYVSGGPFYAPYGTGGFVKFNTLWGNPVAVTKSVKAGQPIAGAWKMGAQYFMREGMQIETSNSHKDYFQRNLMAVLFEERLALAVYRPVAFVELTGFPGRP
jgi:HK97 family phage major capsid protein